MSLNRRRNDAACCAEAAPETAKSVLDGTMTLGAAFDEAIVTGSAERGPFWPLRR